MTPDYLHYPREQLAQSVLHMLTAGLSSALTLFAPRRMGKTEFLVKDLLPLAESNGWRVFYFSFMEDDAGEIAKAFPAALADFAQSGRWIAKTVSKIAGRVKIKGTFGPASVEAMQGPAAATATPTVSGTIATLAQQKRPVLLLLDEIQELARKPGTAGLVASLRTGLDLHKDQVKVIFTGSSQAGLRAMFGDAKAPFFHFATMIDFPPLDEGFTRHLADVFKQITRHELSEAELWEAFQQLGRVPLHIRAMVEELVLNPGRTLAEALPGRLAMLADTSGYERQWQELTALDRLLLHAIASGESRPYGQECRARLAEALGVETLSTSNMQAVLRKLERRDVATKDASGWRFSDPNFAEWLKTQE
ncbi:MAG: ATP-binding protein [Pseudogulbenkiania sp.]|nr:ATP-binding protein [Pseudogulbenkiania sp.]